MPHRAGWNPSPHPIRGGHGSLRFPFLADDSCSLSRSEGDFEFRPPSHGPPPGQARPDFQRVERKPCPAWLGRDWPLCRPPLSERQTITIPGGLPEFVERQCGFSALAFLATQYSRQLRNRRCDHGGESPGRKKTPNFTARARPFWPSGGSRPESDVIGNSEFRSRGFVPRPHSQLPQDWRAGT